ncbi:MAG: tRNA lysidine(34) synthetase TilS [Bacteroidales bacterium]|nr:tRNA lysidine(34) synthetase TilS [Bacteroidales bacterium]
MLQRFISYVTQQHLFPTGQQVLLAVSGGVDSVVLAHLMHSAGYPFAIAHCNFNLRPGDCDRDEAFVRRLARRYRVPFHLAKFDTTAHARSHGQSIEEAARQLRYDWFSTLCQEQGYPAVLTAHHRDDAAETFFINLLRGTGLSGLHGILPVQGHVVRPLLPFGRDDIEAYARSHRLHHVEDVTNASLLYRRNQIRHQVLPLLRQIQPSADTAIATTIAHLQSVEQLYTSLLEPLRRQLVTPGPDGSYCVSLRFDMLEPLPSADTATLRRQLLFELLRPFGFKADSVDALLACTQPGRRFLSATHQAILDRGQLLISPISGADSETLPDIVLQLFDAATCPVDYRHLPPNQALFDADTLRQPLSLRHWQAGDRFQPLGMVKGSQLVSDFFTDHKYSLPEKQRQLLLVDAADRILWIVGRRTTHPFRVTSSSNILLLVTIC